VDNSKLLGPCNASLGPKVNDDSYGQQYFNTFDQTKNQISDENKNVLSC